MKIILDNGHIMHYNNHCSAGVAHLVERDLAKVEVASSSLVARSKITPSDRVVFFLHLPAGQRLEQGTSEARETCRGHVLVPACVWRSGRAASEPRRPLQKETPSFRMVFLCIYRAAGDVLTVMQAAQKRRISTTLLSCSEDRARERYFIICCTFSFSLQPLCQWLHRR